MKLKEIKSKCRKWCAFRIKPTARIMAKIDSEFRHIADYKKSGSLLKKYLTEEMFNVIKYRITPYGSTLLEVIISGIENIESQIGVYAPDGEAYYVFSEIFDPIIKEYHGSTPNPATEYGYAEKIIKIDIENRHILSMKISCNRSLIGYPFNSRLTEDQFSEIEKRVSQDLKRMIGDFEGDYEPLVKMAKKMRSLSIKDHYLFHKTDKFFEEAIGFRFWPIGRGVFSNYLKNFFVWINIEDHLQIVSVEISSNLKACYKRFVAGVRKVGNLLGFMHDAKLGYLNMCPTYLGTGMEISMQMTLYKLPKHKELFEKICKRYDLHVDCGCGNKCTSFICTISYKPKIGMTEFETVKWMQDAILHILRTELHT